MGEPQKIKFFSCRNSRYLAEKIAKHYGSELGNSVVLEFSDGEFQPAYDESIRGCTVFVVCSTFPPADNMMELLLIVSIGAKLVANLLHAAGVDRIMTMDLHADQIQGFFDVPVDHLYASGVFVPYIKSLNIDNLTVATPDIGGSKRANAYAQYLGAPMVICHKHRSKPNVVSEMTAIGEVKGRNVVLFDDMIDTAGTITKAADMMKNMGALSVRAVVTHPVLSGPAYERIAASALDEVITTDTIPLKEGKDTSKFTVLTVADIFADVVERVYNYKEISSMFIF